MEAVARYHDAGAKMFLGQDFAAGQTAQQDLDQALDVLFNHPERRPVHRPPADSAAGDVEPEPGVRRARWPAVFNDNGAGVRGDLAAVVRAILTHPEAGLST